MTTSPLYDAQLPVDQSQTHALVIGVNAYPHLIGGELYDTQPAPKHLLMRQLTSPVHSAVDMTEWLLTRYNNPEAPLGSIELLLSPAAFEPSDRAAGLLDVSAGATVAVHEATFQAIREAASRWYLRADRQRDNVALFYFCGHGLEANDVCLLPADFGATHTFWTDNIINFDTTKRFMERCRAKTQYYFLDCCRNRPEELNLEAAFASIGQPLNRPATAHVYERDAPTYYAAAPSQLAMGTVGGTSYFTSALIECLDGMGARPPGIAQAPIDFNSLYAALRVQVRRHAEESNEPLRCGFDGPCHLPEMTVLHFAPTPVKVMATLALEPVQAHESAHLSITDSLGNVIERSMTGLEPWRLAVTAGKCTVHARFAGDSPFADLELPGMALPPEFRPPLAAAVQERRPAAGSQPPDDSGIQPVREIVIHFDERTSYAWDTPVPVEVYDDQLNLVEEVIVSLSEAKTVTVSEAGLYHVHAELPTGERTMATVQVLPDDSVASVTLTAAEGTPNETLAWAYARQSVGNVSAPLRTLPSSEGMGIFKSLSWPVQTRPKVAVAGLYRMLTGQGPWQFMPVNLGMNEDDSVAGADPRLITNIAIWNSGGAGGERWFPLYLRWRAEYPTGSAGEVGGVVALPMGSDGVQLLFVAADAEAQPRAPVHVLVSGVRPEAETLLAYISQGTYGAARRINEIVLRQADALLYDKGGDPFAACIAGYSLLLTGRLERQDWMRNLADWFPAIPDGAVIYGASLLQGTIDAAARDEARAYLLEAVIRGIPVYTVGLRMLFDSLRALAVEENTTSDESRGDASESPENPDEELLAALAQIRYIAAYADWDAQTTSFSLGSETAQRPFELPL